MRHSPRGFGLTVLKAHAIRRHARATADAISDDYRAGDGATLSKHQLKISSVHRRVVIDRHKVERSGTDPTGRRQPQSPSDCHAQHEREPLHPLRPPRGRLRAWRGDRPVPATAGRSCVAEAKARSSEARTRMQSRRAVGPAIRVRERLYLMSSGIPLPWRFARCASPTGQRQSAGNAATRRRPQSGNDGKS